MTGRRGEGATPVTSPRLRHLRGPSAHARPRRQERRGPRAGAVQRRLSTRNGLLFVSPWIIGFLAFFAYPFVATVYYSFTNFNGVSAPHLVGFANYSAMLHDPLVRTALFNTFYYTVIELPLSTAIALGLALLLNLDVKGRAVYRTIFYIPSVVPLVASSMIFVWIFNPTAGIVNDLLHGLHIPGPNWFFSISWSKPSFVLLGLWGLGQPMVIFLAALQGVPRELYEAANLDGASAFRRLRAVTIPLISPVILFNVIQQLVLCISYFTQAQVIESSDIGGPGNSTWFFVQYLYEQAFSFLKMGYASALGFVLFLLTGIVTVVLFRSSRRWVFYSGGPGD
ncbi:MAG: sugar ABC transporter permease [Actinomycetota bacterium]|nr:sugar ABC transporter permease [Actinomycetota bacterium]